ncbi:MAG: SDR family oxidoreductase [Burkholderiaceae bacterium]
MVGLTATLAGEMAKDGITVNCVSPGAFEPQADGSNFSDAPARDPSWNPEPVMEELRRMSGGGVGIGRPAHPTEVAAAIAFFGSPEASYVTGQHVGASGGTAML